MYSESDIRPILVEEYSSYSETDGLAPKGKGKGKAKDKSEEEYPSSSESVSFPSTSLVELVFGYRQGQPGARERHTGKGKGKDKSTYLGKEEESMEGERQGSVEG